MKWKFAKMPIIPYFCKSIIYSICYYLLINSYLAVLNNAL